MIGVLGGMSWESSLDWYRMANQQVRERLGGYHSAPILLDSLDFAEIEALQATGDWDAAGRVLAAHARGLEAAGAGLVVLCTNTMHRVADQITEAITVPFVHIADATAEAITGAGLSRVGLLGTAFTMEQSFYSDRLAEHGVAALIPGEADRALVHRIIYDELVQGVTTEASRQAYREVIGRLVEDGAEGIILGCTEIELLISQEDSPVPVFPTTALHVAAALAVAEAPPTPFEVYRAGTYLHGTKAELHPGDELLPGFGSNYEDGRVANNVYFSETLDAAAWGAELATGEGKPRIYVVEPTGEFEDDPNVTDKRFPGNPTRSYRTRSSLRVVAELQNWAGHTPEQIAAMVDGLAELQRRGEAEILD